jgi:nitrite reductase/ring-hydroxylating ferredoxin subunit
MAEFLKVAEVAEVPPGTVKHIVLLGRHIALCNVAGKYFAIDNFCVHRGGPLSEGWLDGYILECPWHAWRFDVRTGGVTLDPRMCNPTYEVKVEGDDILIAA